MPEAGANVFAQGSRGDLVSDVDDGEVEIYRECGDGTEESLATIGAGSYFGELGPTLNLPRSASARATMATTLTSYTTRHFRRRFPDEAASTDET
jgi:putative ABC transport system ATP-binding protein